jgi:hypothetical protein
MTVKLKRHVPTVLLVGSLALAGAACEVEEGVEDPGVTDPVEDDGLGDDTGGDDLGGDTGETDETTP